MHRRLFPYLAALSLLLCVILGGLWLWGSWKPAPPTSFTWYLADRGRSSLSIDRSNGRVKIGWRRRWSDLEPREEWAYFGTDIDAEPLPGLRFQKGQLVARPVAPGEDYMNPRPLTPGVRTWPAFSHWELDVPYWLPCALLLPLPVWWAWRRGNTLANWRRSRGLCARCGYDLRATTERCPECGAAADLEVEPDLLGQATRWFLRVTAIVLAAAILSKNFFAALVLLVLAHDPGLSGRPSAQDVADTIILPTLLIVVLGGFALDPKLWRRSDRRKVKAGSMPARLESVVT